MPKEAGALLGLKVRVEWEKQSQRTHLRVVILFYKQYSVTDV